MQCDTNVMVDTKLNVVTCFNNLHNKSGSENVYVPKKSEIEIRLNIIYNKNKYKI